MTHVLFNFLKQRLLVFCLAILVYNPIQAETFVVDGLMYETIGDAKVAVKGIINVADYLEAHNNCLDIPATIIAEGETFTLTRIDNLPCARINTPIERITIPYTVEYVGNNINSPFVHEAWVFGGLNVKDFVIEGKLPFHTTTIAMGMPAPIDEFPFPNPLKVDTLHIPAGSKAHYEKAFHLQGSYYIHYSVLEEDAEIVNDGYTPGLFVSDSWGARILSEENRTAEIYYHLWNDDETELAVPASLTYNGKDYSIEAIGAETFSYTKVQKVNVPASVRTVGGSAFAGSSVVEITGMESVDSLGIGALASSHLKSISIPSSLKSLAAASFVFGEEGHIESFYLPEELQSVEEHAFHNLILDKMYCPSVVPPVAYDDSFFFNNSDHVLYVPQGCKKAYSEAPGWRKFSRIEAILPSAIDGIATDEASEVPEHYNLQGVKIANTTPGTICIERRGTHARKIKL